LCTIKVSRLLGPNNNANEKAAGGGHMTSKVAIIESDVFGLQ
jgi:hypothetical protein